MTLTNQSTHQGSQWVWVSPCTARSSTGAMLASFAEGSLLEPKQKHPWNHFQKNHKPEREAVPTCFEGPLGLEFRPDLRDRRSTHVGAQMLMRTCTHTYIRTHTHSVTHPHIHTYRHTHTQTHTHTHKHTHKCIRTHIPLIYLCSVHASVHRCRKCFALMHTCVCTDSIYLHMLLFP